MALAVCLFAGLHHALRLGGSVVLRFILVARTGGPDDADDEDDDKAADRKNSQLKSPQTLKGRRVKDSAN